MLVFIRKMHTTVLVMFILILMFLMQNIAFAEDSENEILISVRNGDSNKIVCDVDINVVIPAGKGYLYLSVPISYSINTEYSIEPPFSNEILSGYSNFGSRSLIFQIKQKEDASQLKIHIINAEFKIRKSLSDNSLISFDFPITQATSEAAHLYGNVNLVSINRIILESAECDHTIPEKSSRSSNEITYIEFDFGEDQNVTVFLKDSNGNVKNLVLFIFSFFPACFTGAVFRSLPKKQKTKKTLLIVFSIILVMSVVLFFAVVPKEMRLSEGVSLASDTFWGMCFGSIVVLIFNINSIGLRSLPDVANKSEGE